MSCGAEGQKEVNIYINGCSLRWISLSYGRMYQFLGAIEHSECNEIST